MTLTIIAIANLEKNSDQERVKIHISFCNQSTSTHRAHIIYRKTGETKNHNITTEDSDLIWSLRDLHNQTLKVAHPNFTRSDQHIFVDYEDSIKLNLSKHQLFFGYLGPEPLPEDEKIIGIIENSISKQVHEVVFGVLNGKYLSLLMLKDNAILGESWSTIQKSCNYVPFKETTTKSINYQNHVEKYRSKILSLLSYYNWQFKYLCEDHYKYMTPYTFEKNIKQLKQSGLFNKTELKKLEAFLQILDEELNITTADARIEYSSQRLDKKLADAQKKLADAPKKLAKIENENSDLDQLLQDTAIMIYTEILNFTKQINNQNLNWLEEGNASKWLREDYLNAKFNYNHCQNYFHSCVTPLNLDTKILTKKIYQVLKELHYKVYLELFSSDIEYSEFLQKAGYNPKTNQKLKVLCSNNSYSETYKADNENSEPPFKPEINFADADTKLQGVILLLI